MRKPHMEEKKNVIYACLMSEKNPEAHLLNYRFKRDCFMYVNSSEYFSFSNNITSALLQVSLKQLFFIHELVLSK